MNTVMTLCKIMKLCPLADHTVLIQQIDICSALNKDNLFEPYICYSTNKKSPTQCSEAAALCGVIVMDNYFGSRSHAWLVLVRARYYYKMRVSVMCFS